ncbi:MAG TPA: CPBP family intramembrane glutamic endopeptidase [Dehalococcoidia bacterium]|nr:CPBP family intramembrane glutamic endopeptidase [Dehalococcoidia bacterium]
MKINQLMLIYLGAITGAELVTTFVAPVWGIIFYFFILLALIVNSSIVKGQLSEKLLLASNDQTLVLNNIRSSAPQSDRRFLVALALVPLIRIVSLSMPLAEFSVTYWYIIIAIPVAVGIFIVARTLHLRPGEIGLTVGSIYLQVLLGVTGIAFGLVDYFILKPEPLIVALRWQEIMVPTLILLVATGFVEELAFRGVMQRASTKMLGNWGWVYIAVLYAVLQIGQRSALHFMLSLLIALLFGWTVKRTGSILGVSLCHGLINIGLYLIFPFVVF